LRTSENLRRNANHSFVVRSISAPQSGHLSFSLFRTNATGWSEYFGQCEQDTGICRTRPNSSLGMADPFAFVVSAKSGQESRWCAPGRARSEFEDVSSLNWGLGRRTVFELATVCGSNCPAPSWSRTVESRNVEPRDGARLFYFGFRST
jgi:hypothetical protein